MKRSLKKGLPGGPNEKVFSKEGYRSTSPDVNNPFNIIPSGSITMKEKDGTPLKKGPLLGIDNLGNSQLMLPGANYQFPGDVVKEVPLAKKGGPFQNSNIYATNKLFAKNPLFKKRKKGKKAKGIYNPKAKYTYQPGGEIEYNQLPNNYKDALKNFVYPEVIDLPEETDSERYGYDAALGVIKQNPNDPIANMNNPWWREHELFHHLQNQAGAMSTYGAVGQRPNPYVASDEAIGSYYDRRGAEFDIELNKIFEQNPDISEEEAYALAEENLYRNPTSVEGEARNYEGYIEAGNPSIFNKKAFGGEAACPDGFYNDPVKGCVAIEDPNTFYENWFQNRVMPTPEGQKLLDKIRPEALERSRESIPYIFNESLDPNEAGYYDVDTRQIMLNKFLPEAQIQATKYHERMHDIQAGDKFSNVLDKPQGYLVEQNIIEPKAINTGNPEWDKNLKKNYEDIVDPNEIHARIMTLRRLAGFRPDQAISEKDLEDYFKSVKDAGGKLDPDIEDLKGVTKGNKAIVNLLNDMVSVPSNREDLQVAKYGFELDLSEDEIQKYVKGGYVVEDISIPSLTRMDKGGNPIKQLQEKEKAAELSRLIASGAAGGLGNMANYITKAISESENKSKPSSNVSAARATAKPKSLAAVEKLASAPKTKPGEVNLAVRDFVQDAKEIDLKSKKDPYEEKNKIIYIEGDKTELKDPDADARYKQWVMNIEDRNKNQTYLEDFGDWINENIFGAESDIESAYKSIYNPVKPKTYYHNGRQVTGNGPWNNYGDAPVQMVYPEMFFMGPSGGAAGLVGNALKSGSKYAKNVIWPALNTALPLGEGITTATAGTITPFNIASLIFGSQSAANLADSDSESRKSLEKAYNNPTTSNILDAVGNVGLDALGILGSPGVTNMFGSAAGGIGKLFASSDDVIPNTEKLIKGLEKVPSRARPTTEQFKAVIDKNISYIKSPEYKKLRMQNTGETSTQVDKAVSSYVKKLNKTKLTSNKDDAFGTYTSGSLFSNPSINVDSYSMTPEKYLATFDHEIKHALSPFSGRGRYSLYKNYPILEGTPVYKEPSLKEVFFGKGKSPRAIDQQAANYHALPYEQQVRALRLKERMKTDLGISAETPLTEDDVYNWMSNYKYSLPEELGDVDDLLKQIKVGSADAEKTINVMEQPRNMADWMNKAWMLVPGAGVAGAAAYGANDGANYKSGGLIETNDDSIVSELTKKEIDKLIKQGYIIEEID